MRWQVPGCATLFSIAVFLAFPAPASAQPCADQTPFGAPLTRSDDAGNTYNVCKSRADGVGYYLLAYDRARSSPRWAAYHLSRSKMLAAAALDPDRDVHGDFEDDPQISTGGYQAPSDDDFVGVGARGLNRGHIAPAEALSWDIGAYVASFVTTNVAPQDGGLNGGPWAKLEGNVRAWACVRGTVHVVTGVVHGPGAEAPLPRDSGPPIQVPTHFYKVVYTPADGGRVAAFLFENRDHETSVSVLRDAMVTVDEIEALAGIDLFPELPERIAATLEDRRAEPDFWPLDESSRFNCDLEALQAAQAD